MPLFIFCDFHDVTDIDAQCTANSYKHIEPYILIFASFVTAAGLRSAASCRSFFFIPRSISSLNNFL